MGPFSAGSTSPHRHAIVALCVASFFLLGGSDPYPRVSEPSVATIAARAFVITDAETLAPFTFDRVMAALSEGQSANWLEALLSESVRTQRPTVMPLAGFIAAPDEDGYWLPAGRSNWSHVKPIAIVNRFDLAPPDYPHCGEYRLIFSRRTEHAARLHIAVEIVLPKTRQQKGKEACADVVTFWQDLIRTEPADTRRDQLERFFFGGVGSRRAALDPRSFERGGRIRTSEISKARPKFRQFELKRDCASARPCVARLVRVPLDNTPDAALFVAESARGAAFRSEFLRQVASLAIPDVNRYFMNVDHAYSVSDIEGFMPPFNYRLPFRRSLKTRPGQEFREQIAHELKKAGSDLTPENIIDRAETQNCAGCHAKPGPVGNGLVFPKAFDSGEHIADDSLLGAVRLSPALEKVFLPYRIRLLAGFTAKADGDS